MESLTREFCLLKYIVLKRQKVIRVDQQIAVKRRWWRTRITVAALLLSVVQADGLVNIVARVGAVAATAITSVTATAITTELLLRSVQPLGYEVAFMHRIVVVISAP